MINYNIITLQYPIPEFLNFVGYSSHSKSNTHKKSFPENIINVYSFIGKKD